MIVASALCAGCKTLFSEDLLRRNHAKNKARWWVDTIAINTYSIIPTSVTGLLKEEDTNVEGLQIVSPCETITKGQSDQSVVLAIQLPMFCPFSSLVLRVNDTNILT